MGYLTQTKLLLSLRQKNKEMQHICITERNGIKMYYYYDILAYD